MTRRLVDDLNQSPRNVYNGVAQALSFVVGSIVHHDTARGGNPYDGIDVERLFSAVQLLAERGDHELAAFVSAWDPAVDRLDRTKPVWPAFFEKSLMRAIKQEQGVERVLRPAIEGQVSGAGRHVYSALTNAMALALRQLVHIESAASVAYLEPLATLARSQGDLTVVTLNYDLSVEIMAIETHTRLDTGVGEWSSERGLRWPNEGIRLVKIHGSIDWKLENQPPSSPEMLAQDAVVITGDPVGDPSPPAVIFGQRGKLRSTGPFLQLLRVFADQMDQADEVVIIGYSFRDDHVNEEVRRWLNTKAGGRLTIVDPGFYDAVQSRQKAGKFGRELYLLTPGTSSTSSAGPSRVTVYPSTTKDALNDALGRR